jgi:hypothetical protein
VPESESKSEFECECESGSLSVSVSVSSVLSCPAITIIRFVLAQNRQPLKVPRGAKPPWKGAKPPRGGEAPQRGAKPPRGGEAPQGGGEGGAKPRVDIFKKNGFLIWLSLLEIEWLHLLRLTIASTLLMASGCRPCFLSS